MDNTWDRRSFLKRLGVSGAGMLGAGAVGLLARDRGRDEPLPSSRSQRIGNFQKGIDLGNPELIVAKGNPGEAVRAAIDALGGMKRFVRPGERVAIKPNVGWDRTPAQAADTNPIVVATLVELCLGAGASSVVVTDNPCNEAKRCFTRSGIWKAVESAGGKIILPEEHLYKQRDLGGLILGRMPVLEPAVDADRFINVPIAKHHGLCTYSGAMKNLYGVLGGRRNRLHQKIDESIADLADFLRATLTVMDATRVLLRNGPQGGDIADTLELNQVIASTDPVAIDAYACTLINASASEIPYIAMAEQRGLGTADLGKVAKREVS